MKQSKHNIYYSPTKVRTILKRSTDVALDNLKCYCNDPVSNFTRCRKLPARTLFECIMIFSNYSSIGELSHFFEGHGPHFAFYETIMSYLPVTANFLPIIKGQPRGCPFRVRIRILLIFV